MASQKILSVNYIASVLHAVLTKCILPLCLVVKGKQLKDYALQLQFSMLL